MLPDVYSFLELRLNKEDFSAYKCDKPDGYREPPSKDSFRYKVRVRGYGEDAILAIRMSNKDGKDFIELQCWDTDTVRCIEDRVEHRLRIPCKYWELAGDGLKLPKGRLAWMPFCLGQNLIDLLVVPVGLLKSFESEKRHAWDHVPPEVILSEGSAVPREMAEALYHLIDPKPSLSWEVYLIQRAQAETRLQLLLNSCKGRTLDPMLEQIRMGRHTAIRHPWERVLTNGVIPLRYKVVQLPRPITAKVHTRIYSPTRPSAIDLYWDYYNHNRTSSESVEFRCSLLYRLFDPLTDNYLALVDFSDSKRSPQAGVDGWKVLFKLAATDPHSEIWRSINKRTWGLRPADVDRIHRLLLGNGDVAQQVSKIDTVRLMLASVGIIIDIAPHHDDHKCNGAEFEDCSSDEKDDLDPGDVGVVFWDFEQCTHWFGDCIRAACRVSGKA